MQLEVNERVEQLLADEWQRLAKVRQAYSTRRVPRHAMRCLRTDLAPKSGDLVLARITRLGQHGGLHLPNGRRSELWVGDEVIVAYADRYAPSQFEARVPSDLSACQLVAGGGIAGSVVSAHEKLARRATNILPVGLLASDPTGPVLNVADFALPPLPQRRREVTVIAAVGSAMDSGKTTALANLAHGLAGLGLRVGYAKVTGTAAGGDPSLLRDAGAELVLDFTDMGFASTYRVAVEALEEVAEQLVRHLEELGAEVTLLEVADGLFQPETLELLASPRFQSLVDGVLYAAVDSLGAAHGAALLMAQGYRPLGFTGMIAAAPLLAREAQRAVDLPIYGRSELADASLAAKLLDAARGAQR